MTKLRHNKGETLVEVLAAILIGSLSVALLFGYVTVSSELNKKARTTDTAHYNSITAAEKIDVSDTGNVKKEQTLNITVNNNGAETPAEIKIDIYRNGEKGLYSYRKHVDTAGGGGS